MWSVGKVAAMVARAAAKASGEMAGRQTRRVAGAAGPEVERVSSGVRSGCIDVV
jgi:hypothetical protein